jgi:hypothetical protein
LDPETVQDLAILARTARVPQATLDALAKGPEPEAEAEAEVDQAAPPPKPPPEAVQSVYAVIRHMTPPVAKATLLEATKLYRKRSRG